VTAECTVHPDVPSAAEHVRQVYEQGVRYFDCARLYWNGQSEEAYGLGLHGVRKHVFLTSKSVGRTAKDAEKDLETSLRLLETDYRISGRCTPSRAARTSSPS
jgi:aryl-alcohol dehydrogenase-like predicted oxidoreductase